MSGSLQRLDPRAIWTILQDPAANPREAVLIIGAGVVLLIMLILLVGIASMSGEASRGAVPSAVSRRRRRREVWVILGGWMAVLGLIGVTSGAVLTDTLTCARCHLDQLEASIESASAHSEVECSGCHSVPGVAGRAAMAVQTVGDLLLAWTETDIGIAHRKPSSAACLRCHAGIVDETAVRIVRVSHAEFVGEPGYRCLDCHGAAGHGPRGEPDDRPRMTLCLRCHDGETASAHCSLCHPGGITSVRGVSKHDYPQVRLPPVTTCEGCHAMERCDACHGLRLPHPPGWSTGPQHGRAGAFERRKLCRKCHDRSDCAVECHPSEAAPGDSHPVDWRTTHGLSSSAETQAQCRMCHFEGFSCKMCHD